MDPQAGKAWGSTHPPHSLKDDRLLRGAQSVPTRGSGVIFGWSPWYNLPPSLPCPDRLPRCCCPGTDRVGAGADPIGRLEEELGQLGDASGQVGEALLVGEQQVARWQCSLAAGGPPGQQLYRGRRALVGVLGGLYALCCHIISLPNLNHAQTTLGRGLGQRDA